MQRIGEFAPAASQSEAPRSVSAYNGPIGEVIEISGSSSQVRFDGAALARQSGAEDPSLATAGQVGSQIKIRLGSTWLVANVRSLRVDPNYENCVVGFIDFLGEGDEERLTGKIYNFRRGITRYPTPGGQVFPVSGQDMRQMYAADDRAYIEIGTVYPTKDIRAALYVDAMLGKHFALDRKSVV